MSVRRLHSEQPENFAFSPDNMSWAQKQIQKYPEGRQASAVIPLLWRAQEQHDGWLTEPAIRVVGDMLDMPYIRVLEVATFYTMYQLQPVGKKAHIQVCGTTPCMLRGAQDIRAVCKSRIAEHPHEISEDGDFSWEEVECLGSCSNAPMVQIWKDTYEDLTPETFEAMLDNIAAGKEITPGPQNGRHFSVPLGGPTSLIDGFMDCGPEGSGAMAHVVDGAPSASTVFAGVSINGGVQPVKADVKPAANAKPAAKKAANTKAAAPKEQTVAKARPAAKTGTSVAATKAKVTPKTKAAAKTKTTEAPISDEFKPSFLATPDGGKADDLKQIKGIGPKIEGTLNGLGVFHFHQISDWSDDNKVWIDGYLSFKGRIDREQWIQQAKVLAAGGETEFAKRVA
ncbi:MAG: NADH-quinone oxidoreductase subunit E, partial [Rhizobiales bacterium]|nr:NADH-quinone oxidoreductase subunit E [Hyphomicrobiales bacterium]